MSVVWNPAKQLFECVGKQQDDAKSLMEGFDPIKQLTARFHRKRKIVDDSASEASETPTEIVEEEPDGESLGSNDTDVNANLERLESKVDQIASYMHSIVDLLQCIHYNKEVDKKEAERVPNILKPAKAKADTEVEKKVVTMLRASDEDKKKQLQLLMEELGYVTPKKVENYPHFVPYPGK